jgi:RNA polymerase sigma factor (sigma-70 family)
MELAARPRIGSSIVAVGGEGLPDRASVVALVTDVERRHADALLGFVRRLGLVDAVAEDVVQEGLLRLYDEMLRGTHVDDTRAWTFTVVYRLAMSEHRRRSRWRHLHSGTATTSTSSGSDDPVSVAERRMVWREVDLLPERQRAVVYLRYRADLPFDAIGSVLGITASAARSHATQALGRLRLRLGAEESS